MSCWWVDLFASLRATSDTDDQEALLGCGTFGSVFRDVDADGNVTARKVIAATDVRSRETALSEAYHQAQLVHPNIIAVRAVIVHEDAVHIVQEYGGPDTLVQFMLDPVRCRDRARCDAYARDLACAVAHLHLHDMCHCDLKPDNVIVDGVTARLTDFGMCRSRRCGGTTLRTARGTVTYVAPEAHDGVYDGIRADVWSYAILYFSLLFKCLPFAHTCGDCREFQLFRYAQTVEGRQWDECLRHVYSGSHFLTRGDVGDGHRAVLRMILVVDPRVRAEMSVVVDALEHMWKSDGK